MDRLNPNHLSSHYEAIESAAVRLLRGTAGESLTARATDTDCTRKM